MYISWAQNRADLFINRADQSKNAPILASYLQQRPTQDT